MPSRKLWTPEEDATLCELVAARLESGEIARRMNRTRLSIECRRFNRGLQMWVNRRWTPEEDALLRELCAAQLPLSEVATRLGRTKQTIQTRRLLKGIRLHRHTDAADERKAKNLLSADPRLPADELGQRLGCSAAAARRIKRKLGYAPLTHSEAGLVGQSRRAARIGKNPTAAERGVLEILHGGPQSRKSLAAKVGRSLTATYEQLRSLQKKGLAFAEGKVGKSGATWYSLNWWLSSHDRLILMMAHRVHAKAANSRFDFDDLASEMRLAAARCAKTMKTNGLKFSTYAGKAAYYAGIEWCVKQGNRGVHVPVNKLYERDSAPCVTSIEGIAPTDEDRAWEPAAREEQNVPPMGGDFWARVTAALPAPLGELVVGRFRDGKQLAELSRDLLAGKSREWTRTLIERGVEQLRASGAFAEFAPDSAA